MKKILLLLLSISSLSFSNVDYFNSNNLNEKEMKQFPLVSTKYVYNYAIKNENEVKKYEKILENLNKDDYVKLRENVENTEKILTRIFKTEKNLVPKIIKYIYFEPVETENVNILKEEREKLLVSYYANTGAEVYIKANKILGEKYKKMLLESGINSEKVHIMENVETKEIFEDINKKIKDDNPNKNKFGLTEVRILIIGASSKIKENLSLAYPVINKDLIGVEIDDFSYLDEPRVNLEKTTEKTRLEVFKQLINGIY